MHKVDLLWMLTIFNLVDHSGLVPTESLKF